VCVLEFFWNKKFEIKEDEFYKSNYIIFKCIFLLYIIILYKINKIILSSTQDSEANRCVQSRELLSLFSIIS